MNQNDTGRTDGIAAPLREKIIRICNAIAPSAQVWLYGSRARGDFRDTSDIDLAIDAGNRLDYMIVAELQDVLQAALIPYKIDVIDINAVSDEGFKKTVVRDRVLWTI